MCLYVHIILYSVQPTNSAPTSNTIHTTASSKPSTLESGPGNDGTLKSSLAKETLHRNTFAMTHLCALSESKVEETSFQASPIP